MRLSYEPLTTDHARDLFSALADPAVYRHINESPPGSIEELARRISRMSVGPPAGRRDELWWNFAVRLVQTDRLIGRVQATIIDGRAEVAYLLDPLWWGKGYATEAMEWLHQQLREQTAVHAYWATTRPENSRSLKLLRRLDYQPMSEWPQLLSYDAGDLVYRRLAAVG